ncbi:MAG: hypothetical protein ABSF90_11730 [Syntrophobacteraceae bacterium]|jgi:uncharacterized protein involved in exopolysaccharide biosynthesis
MEENSVIQYKSHMSGPGPLAPFSHASVSPILEGGIQHNLRDHLAIIFKHKYKILVCFIIAIMLAPLAYYIVPRFRPSLYEAKSVLMLKSGREYNDPELGTKKTPISFGRQEIFTSEMVMLRSRDLKERIISTVGIEKIYPGIVANSSKDLPALEAGIISFDKDLGVSEVRNSNFIEVSFRNKDPEIAAKVTNLLVDYYVEKRREVLSDPKAVFFLEKKLAEYRQKLRETEERLETFRRNYGFYSFDKQMDFLLKKKSQIEESINATQDEAQTLKQTFAILSNQLKSAPEVNYPSMIDESVSVQDSEEVKRLRAELVTLHQKEQEILGKYTERNQFVVNVRKEIQAAQELIKKEEAHLGQPKKIPLKPQDIVGLGLEQEHSVTETNIRTAEAKIVSLKDELANCQKQINDLGSQEKKLNELYREKEHDEQYYKVYASKVEELRISEDIGRQEMPSVTVLQAAIPPAKPVNQNFHILLYFAIACILGVAAGVGIAYLLEFLSQGLRTPEGVEARLGLPVLATIPCRA